MMKSLALSLIVPAELAEVPHQIAFKAELLKRDRRTVEAVAYTPVHDFPVVNPLVVKISRRVPSGSSKNIPPESRPSACGTTSS